MLTALVIPLLPFIREDFALSYTQSGLVLSAFSLSYGIGQLPAGWLADRIGPRILITIGISGVALAGLLVGLSQTYFIMLIFLVLMGLAGGGYHPAAIPLISASQEPKNRGRALGLHQIGSSVSFFLVPLIAAAIATAWGWRGSFITLAVPTVVFGIILYIFLGRRIGTKGTEHAVTGVQGEAPSRPGSRRRLIAFVILSTFTGAVLFSTVAFIPLFIVDHFGVEEGQAAALLAIVYSSGIWMSPLGGYLSDRLGRLPVILAACLLAGPVIYMLNLAPYGLGTGAVLVAIGIAIYTLLPVAEAYIVGETSEHHRSTILGIYYFCSMEAGGVLTPGMGYLIDRLGFQSCFAIVGVSMVAVTLICSIFLRGDRR